MPYTKKEKKLYQNLVKKYGEEKAERVYNAMETLAAQGKKFTKNFSKKSIKKRKKRLKKKKDALPSHPARRLGRPRTDEERRRRHKALYGTTRLPPRGTGLLLRGGL